MKKNHNPRLFPAVKAGWKVFLAQVKIPKPKTPAWVIRVEIAILIIGGLTLWTLLLRVFWGV